jgi:hypothetical protein
MELSTRWSRLCGLPKRHDAHDVGPRGPLLAAGPASPSTPFLYCGMLLVSYRSSGDARYEDQFLRAAIEKWAGWGGSDTSKSASEEDHRPALLLRDRSTPSPCSRPTL